MLKFLRASLFDSPAQTLVNTVNTVGVMGKGIAREFKLRYPEMFKSYKKICDSGDLSIGTLYLWRSSPKWILNFPTKTTWRKPSKIEYVEIGLKRFSTFYREAGIQSISFPPLGCGNGNLDWNDVRPLMEYYLRPLPITVYIHDFQVQKGYSPEHSDPNEPKAPLGFDEFRNDIRILCEEKRAFFTLSGDRAFSAQIELDNRLSIVRNGKKEYISDNMLESAWTALSSRFLTSEIYSDETSKRHAGYLIAILSELSYTRATEIQHLRKGNHLPHHAVFLSSSPSNVIDVNANCNGTLDRFWASPTN